MTRLAFHRIMQGTKKLPGKNLGTWPQGEKRSFTFDQPGVVPLLCNVHPEMSGYVLVVPTPYYAERDKDGNYKIDNVPDGQHNVVAWRERGKEPIENCVRGRAIPKRTSV